MKQPFMFAVFAATLLGAAPAQAQHVAADLLPPYEVSTIVASMGMRPLDRPIWRNGRYVIDAIDRNGREVRVVLDAHDGQVIAVRPRMREYGYEPRYAPPPPPPPQAYPRGAPYDPRYDQRYGVPPMPPAAVPGRPPSDDDDYFDDERQQGSLLPPPAAARIAPPPSRGANTAPRQVTSIAPAERAIDPVAKPVSGKTGVSRDAVKRDAPVPRPRPAVASAKPDEPKTGSANAAIAGKPSAPDNNASKPDSAKSDAKEANAKAPKPDAARSEPAKAETPQADVRVIDLSKPQTPEKPEDKPGEAIRF